MNTIAAPTVSRFTKSYIDFYLAAREANDPKLGVYVDVAELVSLIDYHYTSGNPLQAVARSVDALNDEDNFN